MPWEDSALPTSLPKSRIQRYSIGVMPWKVVDVAVYPYFYVFGHWSLAPVVTSSGLCTLDEYSCYSNEAYC